MVVWVEQISERREKVNYNIDLIQPTHSRQLTGLNSLTIGPAADARIRSMTSQIWRKRSCKDTHSQSSSKEQVCCDLPGLRVDLADPQML